jgi:molybdenum cofactor cytidylyltransferase
MNTSSIAAIILAAGYSSRMGRLKPLLPLGEGTVIARVVSLFTEAGLGQVLVVLGHAAEEIQPVVEGLGTRAVENPDFADGMFTSVRAGARALGPDTEAFFMLPVDIPLVEGATIGAMLAEREEHPQSIIYPCFQGRRGHPPLLPAGLIPEILDHPADGNLRQVLTPHAGDALNLEVPTPTSCSISTTQTITRNCCAAGGAAPPPPDPRPFALPGNYSPCQGRHLFMKPGQRMATRL